MSDVERIRLGAHLTVRDFVADRGLERSAALAYISLLSLVPLLATVAALYRAFFTLQIDRVIELIAVFLPYEPGSDALATIAGTLIDFVDRATRLGYVGSLVFLAIAFRLFLSVEQTFNDIWGVGTRRTAAVRVFSFTMLVFWGPVVIGLGSSVLLWMGHQPWAPSQALVLGVGRVLVPLLGLTMVYWLAPYTSVHISAAAAGAAVATLGLQLLRLGFVWYLRFFPEINIIYGSLTLAVLFLVVLFLFWLLVILGAETAYVVQNFDALRLEMGGQRTLGRHPVVAAMAVLAECYRRSAAGQPAPTLDELEAALKLGHRAAGNIVGRLLDAGLLALTGPARDAFVPGRDPARLTLGEAAAAAGEAPLEHAASDDPALVRLHVLLADADAARREVLSRKTFADLVAPPD